MEKSEILRISRMFPDLKYFYTILPCAEPGGKEKKTDEKS